MDSTKSHKEIMKALCEIIKQIKITNRLLNKAKGEWIEVWKAVDPFHERDIYKCSICGQQVHYITSFCPSCGADMREREGE